LEHLKQLRTAQQHLIQRLQKRLHVVKKQAYLLLFLPGMASLLQYLQSAIKSNQMQQQLFLRLIQAGATPWLVTGDNEESAGAIARLVGIKGENVIARALPDEKLARVTALKDAGHTVLMIGDGINDAAALAAADLSMAMGTGTDTAISSADITLMRPELMSVVDALTLSKRTLRTIKSNLAWAFAYNVIGIPIAAAGLLTPMYAAGAMAISSLFVVTNSLRIR
jgi:P-type Cu+ transporter